MLGKVDRILRFAVIKAEGSSTHCQYRRCLNPFGNPHTGIKPPPTFEIADKIADGGKQSRRQTGFATDIFLQSAVGVPLKQVFGGGALPAFDKRAEQIIVIRID